jgi:V8-like Glu-specific endopeptidase
MKLAALLTLVLTGCGCASLPVSDVHLTTHRLDMAGGICSGTAIADNKLLTAYHCKALGGPLVKVDGWEVAPTAYSGNEDHDTLVITLPDHPFTHWARMGARPKQGDRVRWWGNPEGEQDVYRQGYVAKVTDSAIIVDATICHGDSGSGLMNDAGEVVGVVSAMSDENGCTFLLAHS